METATFIKITKIQDAPNEKDVDIIGNIYERELNSTEYKLVLENAGIITFNKLENIKFFIKLIDHYANNELIHIDIIENYKSKLILGEN